jgi:MFS family permease
MEGNSHPIQQEHLALLAFPFAQTHHSQRLPAEELFSLDHLGPRLVVPDQSDHRAILVLTQGYMLELLGVILCAFISTAVSRKTLVHWSLCCAAFFSFGALLVEQRGYLLTTGPLIGAQMIAHSAALNFLLVFACERFPTSCRARAVGFIILFGQVGRSVMPAIAGLLLQRTSAVVTVASFNCLYILAWLVSLQLPLPAHRERPLHDVCGKSSSEPLAGGKKRSVTYQTV